MQSLNNVFSFLLAEQEAAEHQAKFEHLQHVGVTPAIIASDIADQYRVFLVLEHFLQSPTLLATQLMLQIPSDVQDRLIERLGAANIFCISLACLFI
jgi:hypothetical protein